MPDTVSYSVLNIPLTGRNLAASRTPRLQPSAVEEYSELLSSEVAHGEWSADPSSGEPLRSSGDSLQSHLEATLKTRPHWLMPAVLQDEADACWLAETPSLTVRGKRLQQIEAFCGSKAAALVMFKEEAARFGISNPMSLQKGSAPGSDTTKDKRTEGDLTRNAWSSNFHGDEAARAAKIAWAISKGTKFAEALAKAAGTVVGRPLPLRK